MEDHKHHAYPCTENIARVWVGASGDDASGEGLERGEERGRSSVYHH